MDGTFGTVLFFKADAWDAAAELEARVLESLLRPNLGGVRGGVSATAK